MKVSEYVPYYDLLFNFEYQTAIDGKKMTVNKMFEDYLDFELTETHLDQLFYFDLASLQKLLEDKYFTPKNVVSYLRNIFDNYRVAGGDPFSWLQVTFQSVNMNPQNYRNDLITSIEKALIDWIENFKRQPIDYLFYHTNPDTLPPQPITKSLYSVLEWATIFYYADETKLLSESPILKTRLEQFMSKHQVNTTFDNFKTKYYEAKKRINEKNDYPINKLELIIPFLKENYKQTVTKVENDIIYLEENKLDY